MTRRGRSLASILEALTNNYYDLKCSVDPDQDGATIGIYVDGKTIFMNYSFDPNGSGYEFIAALSDLSKIDQKTFAYNILKSRQFRGLTPYIDSEKNIFAVIGGRDYLHNHTDHEIQMVFMDDISRVSEYFKSNRDYFL